MKIKILTDSTCDLPKNILDENDITSINLHVQLGQDNYIDGVNIDQDKIFEYAKKYNVLPKTSSANIGEFITEYTKAFDQGYDYVFYMGISSKLSITMQTAVLAKEELANLGYDSERVKIIDSLQLSTGSAHLLLNCARQARQNVPIEEIEKDLLSRIPRLRTSFILDTMQYLHMGGRCSSIVYIAGSMLKIHPQINVQNGSMTVGGKYRGSFEKCLKLYFENTVKKDLDNIDKDLIFITSTASEEIVNAAYGYIKDLGFKEILITRAGATISSHCGPNCLGYLYMLKD